MSWTPDPHYERLGSPEEYLVRAREIFEMAPGFRVDGEWQDLDWSQVSKSDVANAWEACRMELWTWFNNDLYALVRFGLTIGDRVRWDGMRAVDVPYIFELIRRVEEEGLHQKWLYYPRGHYKSTLVHAKVIQEVLRDQNIRIYYYSILKEPNAVDHVGQIRKEIEESKLLRGIAPEVWWTDEELPFAETWTDKEFTVRRTGTGKTMSEPTVRASGFMNHLYTGGHPDILVLDDIEDDTNAHTPTNVDKGVRQYRAAMKISDLVGGKMRYWTIGTAYNQRGVLNTLHQEGDIRGVIRGCAVDRSRPNAEYIDIGGGEPNFLSAAQLRVLRAGKVGAVKDFKSSAWRDYAIQLLCDPEAASSRALSSKYLQAYNKSPVEMGEQCNIYLLMDPGGTPGTSDPSRLDDTAIAIVGLAGDGNRYLLDARVDILQPSERADLVVKWARKWSAIGRFQEARMEEAATGSDCTVIGEKSDREGFIFTIVRIQRGGKQRAGAEVQKKVPRIEGRWEPVLSAKKFFVPKDGIRSMRRGEPIDVVEWLAKCLDHFPTGGFVDLLDCLSFIDEPEDKVVMVYRGANRGERQTIGRPKVPVVWKKVALNPRPIDQVSAEHRWMVA